MEKFKTNISLILIKYLSICMIEFIFSINILNQISLIDLNNLLIKKVIIFNRIYRIKDQIRS
jgi:hypothetical protein